MDLAEARQIIREQPRAVLATTRADGSPQMSPVLAAVAEDGAIVVSSRTTAFKVKNLRRDPRVWLCVLPDAFFGRWIQVEGTASVLELPEAMPGLEDYYRRVSGEHPDWAEYRAAMTSEQRVLVRIEPTRAGPDRSG
ncbi:PPOX class F420-dependent oxidoreductase [Crossiella sp. NPDC003009]